MKIVAFGHRSRTGKDTAAGFLATQLRMRKQNINVQTVSFATLLKKVTYEMFRWAGAKPGEYYEIHPEERNTTLVPINMDIVQLWVAVGESMNNISPYVWINSLFSNCERADILIIRDMRRPHEVEAVTSKGGIKVKITKMDAPVRNTVSDNWLNDFDKWDEVIENDGTLNDLYAKVGLLIDKYGLLT